MHDPLLHILVAQNMNRALHEVFPIEPGVDPRWARYMRLLVQAHIEQGRRHGTMTRTKLAAALFDASHETFMAAIKHTTIGKLLATWDDLMVATLRDCLRNVIQARSAPHFNQRAA